MDPKLLWDDLCLSGWRRALLKAVSLMPLRPGSARQMGRRSNATGRRCEPLAAVTISVRPCGGRAASQSARAARMSTPAPWKAEPAQADLLGVVAPKRWTHEQRPPPR